MIRRFALCIAFFLAGCASTRPPKPVTLPPGPNPDVLVVDDAIRLRVDDGLVHDVVFDRVVGSDGTVDVSCAPHIPVAGLHFTKAGRIVADAIASCSSSAPPHVEVTLLHPRSVAVFGAVAHPGQIPLRPGLTVVSAIVEAGGFSSVAARTRVLVTREGPTEKVRATVDVDAILSGAIPDVPLFAHDTVFVGEAVF